MTGARPMVLGAALAFLSLLAVVVLRRPGTGEGPHAAPRVRVGELDTLEVQRGGALTRIRRDGEGYRVTAPVSYPAADAAARAAFHALEALEPIAIVTDRPSRFAPLEVDEAKGVRVRAGTGRGALELVIGKLVAEGTMVRLRGSDGRAEVWRVEGDLRELFDKSPSDWRDRTITAFAPEGAREITMVAGDGARIVVGREAGAPAGGAADFHAPPAAAAPWKVVASSVPIAELDQQVPNDLIAALSSLNASEFADGATPSSSGLDAPAMTVSVGMAGGAQVVLLVGGAAGKDDRFVKVADRPQIFLIKSFNSERLNRRPIQFRKKMLCDISDGEIVEIAVQHGADSYTLVRERGGSWKATRPSGLTVASEQVAPFASVFRGWRAPEIVEAPPPDAMSRPWAVISGRSPAARCTIEVGSEVPGRDGYYLKTPPSSEVYFAPRWMIDRVVVKLDRLRQRRAGPAFPN